MTNYLLLGAGFSRNWGGWVASEAFEYLLGCPEIISDSRLRDLLWKHQLEGGFEDALAELQSAGTSWAHAGWSEQQLITFQNAVGRMFDDMNRSFMDLEDLEFQRAHSERFVRRFLTRFDAIFSLNQDVLLEHFYLCDNVARAAVKPQIPGMRRSPDAQAIYSESLSRATWSPAPESDSIAGSLSGVLQAVRLVQLVQQRRTTTSYYGRCQTAGDWSTRDSQVVWGKVR